MARSPLKKRLNTTSRRSGYSVKSRVGKAKLPRSVIWPVRITALGNYEKAIESYEQSLAICREVKDRKGEGIVLSLLGGSFNALGRHQKAIEYLDQALAIDREVKARSHEGSALANLARAYYGLRRLEKAIEYYEQSLAISREVKNLEGEGNTLRHLAELERDRGNLDRARILIEERLRIAESLRSDLVSPESRHFSAGLCPGCLRVLHRRADAPAQG